MSLWTVGLPQKCARCNETTEVVFAVKTASGFEASMCPHCIRQGADAALIEAEATGSRVPAGPSPLADGMGSVDDAMAVAKQELVEMLFAYAESAGINLTPVLQDAVVVASLGIDPSFIESEVLPPVQPAQRPSGAAAMARRQLELFRSANKDGQGSD